MTLDGLPGLGNSELAHYAWQLGLWKKWSEPTLFINPDCVSKYCFSHVLFFVQS